MHLLVITALVAALASFVVGLITATAGWVLVSIVLSAVTILVGMRARPRPAALVPAGTAGQDGAAVTARSAGRPVADDDVWVVDGRPRYHRPDCAFISDKPTVAIPITQAVTDGFTACTICQPPRPGPPAH
jgi:hypothetical protein